MPCRFCNTCKLQRAPVVGPKRTGFWGGAAVSNAPLCTFDSIRPAPCFMFKAFKTKSNSTCERQNTSSCPTRPTSQAAAAHPPLQRVVSENTPPRPEQCMRACFAAGWLLGAFISFLFCRFASPSAARGEANQTGRNAFSGQALSAPVLCAACPSQRPLYPQV